MDAHLFWEIMGLLIVSGFIIESCIEAWRR